MVFFVNPKKIYFYSYYFSDGPNKNLTFKRASFVTIRGLDMLIFFQNFSKKMETYRKVYLEFLNFYGVEASYFWLLKQVHSYLVPTCRISDGNWKFILSLRSRDYLLNYLDYFPSPSLLTSSKMSHWGRSSTWIACCHYLKLSFLLNHVLSSTIHQPTPL